MRLLCPLVSNFSNAFNKFSQPRRAGLMVRA